MRQYKLISFCVVACFVSLVHSVYIGTGRGAIQAVQSGTKYSVQEVSPFWDYVSEDPDSMDWTFSKDSSFPNGVFIESTKFPGLVWDTQGYQFVAGTHIDLYAKKNTLVDTKNQRWLQTKNELGIIYSSSMVANVTQSGSVVLAYGTNSAYQQFYSVDTFVSLTLTINGLGGDLSASVQSQVGPYDLDIDTTISPQAINVPAGAVITFHLNPDYSYTATQDAWVTIPPPPALPENTPTQWSGMIQVDDNNYNMSATLTFTDDGSITGSGSDEYFGDFTVEGEVDPFNMQLTYSNTTLSATEGAIAANPLDISGLATTYDSDCECINYYPFDLQMQ